MSRHVPLETFLYFDATGFATHVLVELSQYLPVDVEGGLSREEIVVASHCLPVREQVAVLADSGLKQVFELSVQPIVSSSPAERRPVGAPVSFRSQGGSFIRNVVAVTTGSMIQRTVVYRVEECPPRRADHRPLAAVRKDAECVNDKAATIGFQARTLEISYQQFQYYDMPDGAAVSVDVTIQGVYTDGEGPQEGPWLYQKRVVDHELVFDAELTDVTQVEFLPYRLDGEGNLVPYGYTVTRSADPGYFLTNVIGHSSGTPAQPINSASIVQEQPVPIPVEEDGDYVLTPRKLAEKEKARGGKKAPDRPARPAAGSRRL